MKRAVLLVCVMLFSCAPTDTGPPPTTPRITEGSEDADLRAVLPTLEDVRLARGAPIAIEEVPVEDGSLYENPDPRGFCGQKTEQPDWADAAIASFQTRSGPGMLIVVSAWELPDGKAARLYAQAREDVGKKCPPFRSKTPFHADQLVEPLRSYEIPGVGDGAVGAVQRITLGSQPPAFGGGAVILDDTRLVVGMIISEVDPGDEFVRGLAEAVGQNLG